MNKIDSINTQYKESTFKISHPAIGDLYCRNVREAQGTLHEICEDQLYFQSGISVSPGDVILDVGANIGVFSLCAATQGARVYAFEPIPSTFAVLELNVRLHGLESVVKARNTGLSDRTEKKMMFQKASPVCSELTRTWASCPNARITRPLSTPRDLVSIFSFIVLLRQILLWPQGFC